VAAVLVTSVAFAIMHVPFYGPHVLLLDFGVGLALGGLRLLTRGVRAPAVAHVVADAATWWL
jgi:membrane protease YdiL (CAAX protease family)